VVLSYAEDDRLQTSHSVFIMIQLVHSLGYTLDDLAPISTERQETAAPISERVLNEEHIKIARSYTGASSGTQEAVRKILDVEHDERAVFIGSTQSTAKMA